MIFDRLKNDTKIEHTISQKRLDHTVIFTDKALFIEVKINNVNNKKYHCAEDVLKEASE